MYTPKNFQQTDERVVKEFIRDNGFGTLISHVDTKLWATHIPMVLSEDGNKLTGHVSRANRAWRAFESEEEILAIFQGPHTYISSSWYDHENVPTWNYIAAHVYGPIRIITGDELFDSIKTLIEKYERHEENPLSMRSFSEGYIEKQMNGVAGFEIAINRIEASYKLSQNRDLKNSQAIIEKLEQRGDADSKGIADHMRKNNQKAV